MCVLSDYAYIMQLDIKEYLNHKDSNREISSLLKDFETKNNMVLKELEEAKEESAICENKLAEWDTVVQTIENQIVAISKDGKTREYYNLTEMLNVKKLYRDGLLMDLKKTENDVNLLEEMKKRLKFNITVCKTTLLQNQ